MKLSIITPCLNPGIIIKQAVESVLCQDYSSWEHIIIDGGSTDGTLELLASYPHLKIISEPDGGQADAMNKGIDIATGFAVGFLNADDYYFPKAFSSVVQAFDENTSVIVGNVLVKSRRMNIEFLNEPRTTLEGMMRHWEPNAFSYNPVGYFCRIELQKQIRFNANNYSTMDLEFLLALAAETPFKKIETTLGCFEDSLDTKTDKTMLSPSYWRVSTFPYVDQYISRLDEVQRQQFIADRREGYAAQQAESNHRSRQRHKAFLSTKDEFKISIIIPTHNDIHLACGAIESVLKQSHKNIEIIVVDDASDQPAEYFLSLKYPNNDKIRTIRNDTNRMPGGARNEGLVHSTGDYIFFLDADDQLLDGALSRLVTIAVTCGADIVQGGSQIQGRNGQIDHFHSADFASDGGIDGLELFAQHRFASIPWNKLYKSKFLRAENGPRFSEDFAHEDVTFSAKAAFLASSIVSVTDFIILYRFNPSSITRKVPTRKNIDSYISMYLDMVNALTEFGVNSDKHRFLFEEIMMAHVASDVGPKLIRCNSQMGSSAFAKELQASCSDAFGGHGISVANLLIFFVSAVEAARAEARSLRERHGEISDLSEHFGDSRPRILVDGIFWQFNNTGIARVWTNLLKEWVKCGFAKNIILLDRGGTAPRIDGVQYWMISRYEYINSGSESLDLQELCDRFEADLFISSYYTTPTKTPSMFVGYDMIPELYGFNLNEPVWREKRKAILHAAAHTMISMNSAKDLERCYPELSSGSTYVSYPGIAPEFKRANSNLIELFRIKYNLADRPYVLFVGNRTEYKNGSLAFRACAILPKERQFVLVCVGGYVEIETELLEMAPDLDVRKLSLTDEELVVAYSGAHCLLYPSKYEGFGLPPLEAMACGTPAIACRNSSLPEAVGDAALFVNDIDPRDARLAILSLFEVDIRAKLIAKGYAQASKFSFSRMAQDMKAALTETCDRVHKGQIPGPSSVWTELRQTEKALQAGLDFSLPLTSGKANIALDDYQIDFAAPSLPVFLKDVHGLETNETWGRWTVGPEFSLTFVRTLPRMFTLIIDGYAYESNDNLPITVSVGSFTTKFTMSSSKVNVPYHIDISNLDYADCITFAIPNSQSPTVFTSGAQTDLRKLGIALVQLQLIERKEYEGLESDILTVPVANSSSQAIDWAGPPCLIDFTSSLLPTFVKEVSGLGDSESWGRWTIGPKFFLKFYGSLPKVFTLEILGRPYASCDGKPVNVAVGDFLTSFVMRNPILEETYYIKIVNEDGADCITFHIPDAQSPACFTGGASNDQREIGIALISLKLIAM